VDFGIFFRGVAMGFALAAPVGPIGVLCIQRTLAYGTSAGLASGLGAATADAIYGVVAAFGLSWLSDLITERHVWFSLAGGVFLTVLGIRTFLHEPRQAAPALPRSGLLRAYLSTLALTLSNPMTVVALAGVFAAAGMGIFGHGPRAIGTLAAGVFTGSAIWWSLLSNGIALARGRFDTRAQRWMNRVSGLAILVSAGVVLSGRW
jgi:threonine/homoserine/homoserine lactone efflux protein